MKSVQLAIMKSFDLKDFKTFEFDNLMFQVKLCMVGQLNLLKSKPTVILLSVRGWKVVVMRPHLHIV